ncbi:2-succinyl-5-enolpyruvyl-6-hydroxy-3-cyclohexene-1-carboxylic-acid synthase [Nesterenkonia marinintestina]|uniref:2-succinyl-5-enolpyruvyl-6-hydroxy-3- cyclohexene-1-carboxylic-acid synthase n=1 Tax=Nesterenkonia marinintestina TaxID=2979865 RepID=UPI0021BE9001|nr:2-succinyl-5-enolpyruvyl-6-hydroxy-3-cyclohexene-1-carboxylic-acid synthase [Nesterenkonia sp. GX14115]
MRTPGGPFREFDDSQDAESLRLARRAVRGLCLSMRHVVLAPGSRSAPMAYALHEAEQLGALTLHTRIDERSAAYTALGIALADGEPAGVVTTSGTAAGNLLPAVMEADMSGVPLVVITADRPEDMHGTGANQTVWQQGMFEGRVRDEIHLEQGETRLEPASRDDILSAETQVALLMRQATDSRGRGSGPVHLNIGFRDPLTPVADLDGQRWARKPVIPAERRRALYDASPSEHLRAAELLASTDEPAWIDDAERRTAQDQIRARLIAESQVTPRRTVFVLGDRAPADAARTALALGHPILAEPTSGAREHSVPAYRLLLTSDAALSDQIERVVVAGRPTLSRPVARLIARDDVEVRQFAPDPLPWADRRLPREVFRDGRALAEFAGVAPSEWRRRWQEAGERLRRVVDDELAAESQAAAARGPGSMMLSVAAAKTVVDTARTPVLLGSSSVIRDVDLSVDLNGPDPQRLTALRGLSGIDGNLSAASGMTLASGRRVTAVLGDLTFLHDLNALLIPSTEAPPSVDVVVINDAGGAIFDQLEHGEIGRRPGRAEVVERLFGTPQAVDLEKIAAGFGVEHRRPTTPTELADALAHPDDRLGLRIVEVRTDRSRLRDLHARIAARAREA